MAAAVGKESPLRTRVRAEAPIPAERVVLTAQLAADPVLQVQHPVTLDDHLGIVQ